MAREAEVSKSTVQRVWSDNEIKPHRLEILRSPMIRTLKRNSGTSSGSIWIRPERALVLCCDEKSQCQALERTQLPSSSEEGLSAAPRPMIISATAPSRSSQL